jgi:hypothetical protein
MFLATLKKTIVAFAVTAAAKYFLDPDHGAERRARLRDRAYAAAAWVFETRRSLGRATAHAGSDRTTG